MRILVLVAESPERDVSLRSAKAVAKAAKQAGFNVNVAGPKDWLKSLDGVSPGTIVLPISHGAGGEDGVVQKELELRNLKYLGSNSRSSEMCFDKWKTRKRLIVNNIPVPKAVLVDKQSYPKQTLSQRPHVLKVVHGGSSIGTLIVRRPPADAAEVTKLFKLDRKALVEELIEGIELTVPVLGNKALPVIEIIPPVGLEFDYENKYNGATQEICPPENIAPAIQRRAQHLAEVIHRIMGCRDLSRTDFMLDADGHLYALEINTIPGMTDQSLFPKAAAVAGLSMPKLVKKFVEMVTRDHQLPR